ncbi:hypothetical protein Taro_039428 [Colocasia esculenta]|uniref:DEP domain-containing protein n=1 Tax=Colocasia esculenta TaxID=4460 RepID=A0A843W9B4_COLES|nr:hypothetical protein [Colocasia esculenta]
MACSEAEEPKVATTPAPAPDGAPPAPLMDGKHEDRTAAGDGDEDNFSAGDSDGKLGGDASSGNEEDSDGGRPASWSGEGDSDSSVGDAVCGGGKDVGRREVRLLAPPSHLPQPEAPPGLTKLVSNGGEDFRPMERSLSENAAPIDVSSIGKYLRDRGSTLSAALARRISSLREQPDDDVNEFNLSGLRVIVRPKEAPESDGNIALKGRISFFSRSNCRDCTAVRSFFREKGLPYVEINVDVFPAREKELIARAGSASVPQVFFNEKLLGGLVALNSLRNSGEFDRRLQEMVGRRCPSSAPPVPVYGFDDEEAEGKEKDAMVGTVRVLRQRLPIQDRLSKMKIVKNCFDGSDLVEAIIDHLDCGRKKAVEMGKELCRKHFIHHVFREKDFEDGSHLYRLLEHDPLIPRCFNIRGTTNDDEPKPASAVGRRLTKLMWAMLEAYASADRRHLDYARISASEEFRRYVNVVEDLQRVDVFALSDDERMAFFLNLHNAMAIHAVIRMGRPEGVIDRRAFSGDFHYIVGGYPYSLSTIKNGILRSNRRPPYSFVKPFGGSDRRLQLTLPKLHPLIHFGLCNGSRSSPAVRFFSGQGTELELRNAAREFFLGGGLEVDLEKRSVHLTRIIKWYSVDFGEEKEFLKWVIPYLDASKAGLLTHVLSDGGPVTIVYQNFDWSENS